MEENAMVLTEQQMSELVRICETACMVLDGLVDPRAIGESLAHMLVERGLIEGRVLDLEFFLQATLSAAREAEVPYGLFQSGFSSGLTRIADEIGEAVISLEWVPLDPELPDEP